MVQKKYKKVLIVFSNFYPEISQNLVDGAESYLKRKDISFEKKSVNGSLEIPFLLLKYKKEYSGFIVLGCVIKGETDHYKIVRDVSFKKIYSIAYDESLPLGSALLTVKNYEQAVERSDINKKNLGEKAAIVCCNLMVSLGC
jgi:6,7-dimethyl-8-ribityllumazine synthase